MRIQWDIIKSDFLLKDKQIRRTRTQLESFKTMVIGRSKGGTVGRELVNLIMIVFDFYCLFVM